MTSLSEKLGLVSIVIGCLLNILVFAYLTSSMIAMILLGIIGIVLSILSLFLKYEKKWISLLGLVLNLIPLLYFALLFVALG
ncbi:hypothetical protein J0J70_05080 [Turicibacter bilis]|uniref:Uncharacterized protein n=1 Tax=Turicibacter bilis TaxID=2735723 RepID=A0A9Q9CIU6_9FIRM|nr:hypothetical protein [Turicibacter bilis]MBS3198277.1 hypothetical protein [Turicibacter bilis]UUF09335.1 hypothetical protein J0J70_05080 [Turicibacter bilis]